MFPSYKFGYFFVTLLSSIIFYRILNYNFEFKIPVYFVKKIEDIFCKYYLNHNLLIENIYLNKQKYYLVSNNIKISERHSSKPIISVEKVKLQFKNLLDLLRLESLKFASFENINLEIESIEKIFHLIREKIIINKLYHQNQLAKNKLLGKKYKVILTNAFINCKKYKLKLNKLNLFVNNDYFKLHANGYLNSSYEKFRLVIKINLKTDKLYLDLFYKTLNLASNEIIKSLISDYFNVNVIQGITNFSFVYNGSFKEILSIDKLSENNIWKLIINNSKIVINSRLVRFLYGDVQNNLSSNFMLYNKIFKVNLLFNPYENNNNNAYNNKINISLKGTLGNEFKSVENITSKFTAKLYNFNGLNLYNFLKKKANLQFDVKNLGAENVVISGILHSNKKLDNYKDIKAKIIFEGEKLLYNTYELHNIKLNIIKHDDKIFASFIAETKDGKTDGSIKGKIINNNFDFISEYKLNFHNIPLNILNLTYLKSGYANVKSSGNINFVSKVFDYSAKGLAEIKYFKFKNLIFSKVTFDFLFDKDNWRICNISSKLVDNPKNQSNIYNNEIYLPGEIRNGVIKSNIICKYFDLDLIKDYFANIGGTLSFAGSINGDLYNPKISGNLDIQNFTLPDYGLKNIKIKANFSFIDNIITLDPAIIYFSNYQVAECILEYNFYIKKLNSIYLKFINLDEKILSKDILYKYLHFNFENYKFSGNIIFVESNQDISIYLENSYIKLNNHEFQNIQFDGKYNKSFILFHVNQLKCKYNNGEINVNGKYANRDNFELYVKGNNINYKNGLASKSKLLFRGINFDGYIQAKSAKRKGSFSFLCNSFYYKDVNLGGIGGILKINEDSIKIKTLFDKLSLNVFSDIDISSGNYKIIVETNKLNLNKIIEIKDNSYFYFDDFAISAKAFISGNFWINLKPDFASIIISKILISRKNSVLELERECLIKYEKNKYSCDIIKFKLGSSRLKLKVIIDKDLWKLEADISKLLLREFKNFIPGLDIDYDGIINLKGEFQSIHNKSQNVKGNLIIENFRYRARVLPDLNINFALDENSIEISRCEIRFKDFFAEIMGKIPRNFLYENKDELYIRIVVPRANISSIKYLLPDVVNNIEGICEGDIEIKGKLGKPQIAGRLNLNVPKLSLKGLNQTIKNLIFDLDTYAKKLVIRNVYCQIGGGKVTGNGSVDFTNGIDGMIDFKLNGHKLDLDFSWFKGKGINVNLEVSKFITEPIIKADINFKKTTIGIDDFRNSSLISKVNKNKMPIFKNVSYNIKLHAPKNFWVKNSYINSELKGSLKIEGVNNDYQIIGDMQIIRGWVYFQRRKFNIESGEIRFGEFIESSKDQKNEPYLNIKSSAKIQNVQIFLTVEGFISNLNSKLYSSPPLSEGDILSLIVVGKNLNEALQTNVKSLFEKEILEGLRNTYLTGLIGSQISRVLNLDELYLGSLFDKELGITQSYLRIGKYLSNDIFLAYEGTLSNEGKKSYIIEYRLPRSFIFTFEFEKPENKSKFGIAYDWKF